MISGSSYDSKIKEELKKQIISLKGSSNSDLTEAYLNTLTIKQLRDISVIARTMRIRKIKKN